MSATPDLHPDVHLDTFLVSAGRPLPEPGAPVNPPVVLSSTYVADGPVNYARAGNPTWDAFEEALGGLEGGRALVHASGMGAISAALSLVPARGTVVAPDTTYNGTVQLLEALEQAGGTVRRRHATDTAGFVSALDGADLVWIESPTNPLMDVMDVRTVLDAARARGVLSVVDNTLPTPLGCRPLTLGADVVVHSATKYIAGHSDVLLGVTVVADDAGGAEIGERLRRHPNAARRDRRAAGGLPRPARTAHARPSLRAGQRQRGRARDSPARAPGRRAGSLPRQRRDAFHRRPR